MAQQAQRQFKRTQEAFARISLGKRFVIPTRKWIDPVDLNRGGFLRIDGHVTALKRVPELERHRSQSTSDDVQMLLAVLKYIRKSGRLWLWIWHSDRGVHILEPAGVDVAALDRTLALRFRASNADAGGM